MHLKLIYSAPMLLVKRTEHFTIKEKKKQKLIKPGREKLRIRMNDSQIYMQNEIDITSLIQFAILLLSINLEL